MAVNGDKAEDGGPASIEILDEAVLLRRVHPTQIVLDGITGRRRVSSAAFTNHEMSVDAEPILIEDGLSWQFSLQKHPGHSLVSFAAAAARQVNQAVEHKPKPENRSHTEVIGKKTGPVKEHLRTTCVWVHLQPPEK